MAITLGDIGEEMNLRIRQGATFGPYRFAMRNPDGTPVDLTGCVIRGQLRSRASSDSAIDLAVDITDPPGGEYQISLSDATTAGMKAGNSTLSSDSRYVWDLELTDTLGRVTPLYYGIASTFREVTR